MHPLTKPPFRSGYRYHADIESVLVTRDIKTLDRMVDMHRFHWKKKMSRNNLPPRNGCSGSWMELYLSAQVLIQSFHQGPWGEKDTIWDDFEREIGERALLPCEIMNLQLKMLKEISPDVFRPADSTTADPESPSAPA